jgi:Zn-dependent M28 family amino/carboxypeptidase
MKRSERGTGARVARACAVAMATLAPVAGAPPVHAAPAFSLEAIKHDTQVLSSDAYEGRGPLSAGEDKTVAWLTTAMKSAGLAPGLRDGYVQAVPLVETQTLTAQAPRFAVKDGAVDFAYGKDVTLNTRRATTRSDLHGSGVVFVGYGVNAPEHRWNDYAGIDVRGKTVLVLINDPDWRNTSTQGEFGGVAMTYYGRWMYKYEEAARQGAAAAIIVHDDAAAGYPFSVPASSLGGARVSLDDADAGGLQVESWITHDAARRLVAAAGQDLAALERAAAERGFKARPLGIDADIGFDVKSRRGVSRNVLGLLGGTKRPDEVVIYTAHWDHLGLCPPDARGDTICNGAIDNATGVAGLLELARAFRRAGGSERSILFLATTGEEYGLLGSSYYAAHPAYPLARSVAEIDLDPLGFMLGRTRDIRLVADQTELAAVVRASAAAQGRVVEPDASPEAGDRYRSDTLSFARAGIPVVLLGNGVDVVDKPTGTGKALLADYFEHRYHQPSDEYDPHWDWSGAMQDIALYYDIGRRLANDTAWPNWYPHDEFRAARDRVLAVAKQRAK